MSDAKKQTNCQWFARIATMSIFTPCVAALCGCTSPKPKSELAYFPAPPTRPHVVHLKSFNSLGDLVPTPATFVDMVRGRPVRPFVETPAGIAYHDGHLYICDVTLRVVHDWNLATGEARRLSTAASRPLVSPIALTVDSNGRVYVGDTGRGEIVTFGANGQSGAAIRPPENEPFRPVALAVRNEELYAADTAGARILVLSTSDGHVIRTIGGASDE
ncbi:MAG: hypothetical protein HY287_01440, partial [Planctomycetes bacterium]|nr:hypothetical protein [Planctomycetota bacterium]MBI3832971.1 hypothetical protein [Planctomycetota bacterium]